MEVAQRSACTRNGALYRVADVARVELVAEPGMRQLTMRAGAAHAYQLGGNANAARQAILRVMADGITG